MVKAELALIQEIQHERYWENISVEMINRLRLKLRNLVQFVDRKTRETVITSLPDQLSPEMITEADVPTFETGVSVLQYRKKVEQLIMAQQDSLVIGKLKRNQALTSQDLLSLEAMLFTPDAAGSRDEFTSAYGEDVRLPVFIRKLVGLDRGAAKAAFGKYLTEASFTANQIRFVDTVIDYLTKNGVMDPGLLYEPPFTDSHPDGVEGVFGDADVDNIIRIVRSFNQTVNAQFG